MQFTKAYGITCKVTPRLTSNNSGNRFYCDLQKHMLPQRTLEVLTKHIDGLGCIERS